MTLILFRNIKPKQMAQEIPIMQQCQAITDKHRGEPGTGQSSVSEVEIRRLGEADLRVHNNKK